MYEVSIQDAVQEFMDEKKALNLSKSTLYEYMVHIKQFISISDIEHISDINKDAYQAFVDFLKADGNKNDVTVASYCRSIRVFLYWAMENEYIKHFRVRLPKYQAKIKRCYTDDELMALLKRPQQQCTEVEYLSWVFVNLICATGMRLRSARNIKVSDIQDKVLFKRLSNSAALFKFCISLSCRYRKVGTQQQYLPNSH